MIHANSRDQLAAFPTKDLRVGDWAVIHFRSPKGEFWADEYLLWTGERWKYDHHTDPPGPNC